MVFPEPDLPIITFILFFSNLKFNLENIFLLSIENVASLNSIKFFIPINLLFPQSSELPWFLDISFLIEK